MSRTTMVRGYAPPFDDWASPADACRSPICGRALGAPGELHARYIAGGWTRRAVGSLPWWAAWSPSHRTSCMGATWWPLPVARGCNCECARPNPSPALRPTEPTCLESQHRSRGSGGPWPARPFTSGVRMFDGLGGWSKTDGDGLLRRW